MSEFRGGLRNWAVNLMSTTAGALHELITACISHFQATMTFETSMRALAMIPLRVSSSLEKGSQNWVANLVSALHNLNRRTCISPTQTPYLA